VPQQQHAIHDQQYRHQPHEQPTVRQHYERRGVSVQNTQPSLQATQPSTEAGLAAAPGQAAANEQPRPERRPTAASSPPRDGVPSGPASGEPSQALRCEPGSGACGPMSYANRTRSGP
jgi:hypothetical protein